MSNKDLLVPLQSSSSSSDGLSQARDDDVVPERQSQLRIKWQSQEVQLQQQIRDARPSPKVAATGGCNDDTAAGGNDDTTELSHSDDPVVLGVKPSVSEKYRNNPAFFSTPDVRCATNSLLVVNNSSGNSIGGGSDDSSSNDLSLKRRRRSSLLRRSVSSSALIKSSAYLSAGAPAAPLNSGTSSARSAFLGNLLANAAHDDKKKKNRPANQDCGEINKTSETLSKFRQFQQEIAILADDSESLDTHEVGGTDSPQFYDNHNKFHPGKSGGDSEQPKRFQHGLSDSSAASSSFSSSSSTAFSTNNTATNTPAKHDIQNLQKQMASSFGSSDSSNSTNNSHDATGVLKKSNYQSDNDLKHSSSESVNSNDNETTTTASVRKLQLQLSHQHNLLDDEISKNRRQGLLRSGSFTSRPSRTIHTVVNPLDVTLILKQQLKESTGNESADRSANYRSDEPIDTNYKKVFRYQLCPNHTGNNRVSVMIDLQLKAFVRAMRDEEDDVQNTHRKSIVKGNTNTNRKSVLDICLDVLTTVEQQWEGRFLLQVEQNNVIGYTLLSKLDAIQAIHDLFEEELQHPQQYQSKIYLQSSQHEEHPKSMRFPSAPQMMKNKESGTYLSNIRSTSVTSISSSLPIDGSDVNNVHDDDNYSIASSLTNSVATNHTKQSIGTNQIKQQSAYTSSTAPSSESLESSQATSSSLDNDRSNTKTSKIAQNSASSSASSSSIFPLYNGQPTDVHKSALESLQRRKKRQYATNKISSLVTGRGIPLAGTAGRTTTNSINNNINPLHSNAINDVHNSITSVSSLPTNLVSDARSSMGMSLSMEDATRKTLSSSLPTEMSSLSSLLGTDDTLKVNESNMETRSPRLSLPKDTGTYVSRSSSVPGNVGTSSTGMLPSARKTAVPPEVFRRSSNSSAGFGGHLEAIFDDQEGEFDESAKHPLDLGLDAVSELDEFSEKLKSTQLPPIVNPTKTRAASYDASSSQEGNLNQPQQASTPVDLYNHQQYLRLQQQQQIHGRFNSSSGISDSINNRSRNNDWIATGSLGSSMSLYPIQDTVTNDDETAATSLEQYLAEQLYYQNSGSSNDEMSKELHQFQTIFSSSALGNNTIHTNSLTGDIRLNDPRSSTHPAIYNANFPKTSQIPMSTSIYSTSSSASTSPMSQLNHLLNSQNPPSVQLDDTNSTVVMLSQLQQQQNLNALRTLQQEHHQQAMDRRHQQLQSILTSNEQQHLFRQIAGQEQQHQSSSAMTSNYLPTNYSPHMAMMNQSQLLENQQQQQMSMHHFDNSQRHRSMLSQHSIASANTHHITNNRRSSRLSEFSQSIIQDMLLQLGGYADDDESIDGTYS